MQRPEDLRRRHCGMAGLTRMTPTTTTAARVQTTATMQTRRRSKRTTRWVWQLTFRLLSRNFEALDPHTHDRCRRGVCAASDNSGDAHRHAKI